MRLFEQVLLLLERLADPGPVVLVVEDMHWADRSSRDLLAFLIRNQPSADSVLMVVTYRSDDLDHVHPLRPLLAELARIGWVVRVASAGGDRIGHGLLAAVTRLDDDALARALRPAVAANVLLADAHQGHGTPQPERARYDQDSIYRVLDRGRVAHVGFCAERQPYCIPTL